MEKRHLMLVETARSNDGPAWLAGLGAERGPATKAVARAIAFAAPHYEGRSAPNGEPLIERALRVAETLAGLRLDADALAAGLLYPLLDLDPAAGESIRSTFGSAVADLVEGVARMGAIGALSVRAAAPKPGEQAAQLEAMRKMLLAMVADVRVVLIRLADHLQALREATRSADRARQEELGSLTQDIFAPLANRLGVWQLKWELEDLAFRLLEPDTYKRIARLLDEKRANRERYIDGVIALLKGELAQAGIAAEVSGRPKHIYSIYRKMQRKGVGFEALHDVRAVRVLVASVKDCYAALGLIHHLWSPIPKEFDDYIAKPKRNDYRSLHTAVIGPEGKAVEVQIRTHEMHQHAELGVAAHWHYKEGGRYDRGYGERIAWLRQILDWKDDVVDAGELAEHFKTGLFADAVYVLTPQGKVIDLPKGATPIDFAYHVHTELGHRCRGAKVDGVMVPLNTVLDNGQQVEILAAKQGGPSRDWLNPALGYLKSQAARTKVRQWFNRQNLDADLAQGRATLDRELQRHGLTAQKHEKIAQDLGYAKADEFLADLGRGEIGKKQLAAALRPQPPASAPESSAALPVPTGRSRARPRGSVLVVGVDKLMTQMAKCCKPAPPEPIVGFVTRGRGVTVHRLDCANVGRLDPERRMAAAWGDAEGAVFAVDIEVDATDRTGLLRDISEVLSRERINVTATKSTSSDMAARMRFTVEIGNLAHLERVLALIRDVRGVLAARRR